MSFTDALQIGGNIASLYLTLYPICLAPEQCEHKHTSVQLLWSIFPAISMLIICLPVHEMPILSVGN
ncbi:hypothetical protein F4802DRAFT_549922 [Xylaria palmicola]|nr:hypothetical protein F4802DRAFT_549922 [Xylaria palmicola]